MAKITEKEYKKLEKNGVIEDYDDDEDEDLDEDDELEEDESEEDESDDDDESEEEEEDFKDKDTSKDSKKTDPKKVEEEKKKQSKEEDAKFAALRRQSEAAKRDQEQREKAAYERGIVEAYGGVNKFTEEKLVDSHDIQIFINMLEMEKKGLDPIKDYYKYSKEQSKIIEEKRQSTQKNAEWFRKDADEFSKKYPDITIDQLKADSRFIKFSDGKIGNVPLTKIYEDYSDFMVDVDKSAKTNAQKIVAKAKATPGSLANKSHEDDADSYYSIDQIKKMSQSEVTKNYRKVEKSLAYHNKSK